METSIHAILMATAGAGQTITRNTGVSIALVLVLLGTAFWVGQKTTSTDFRLSGVEESIDKIEAKQQQILELLTNTNQSSMIENAIHKVLFVEDIE